MKINIALVLLCALQCFSIERTQNPLSWYLSCKSAVPNATCAEPPCKLLEFSIWNHINFIWLFQTYLAIQQYECSDLFENHHLSNSRLFYWTSSTYLCVVHHVLHHDIYLSSTHLVRVFTC